MRYQVSLGGKELEIELSSTAPGRYVARLGAGESRRELEVIVLGDRPTLAVLIDNQVVELVPIGAGRSTARGTRTPAELRSAAEARLARQARGPGAGASTIRAPMPGRIVKVVVSPGDTVVAGQPALVIEAMKMENELACPQSGVVTQVLVKPGDAVERGATLVQIG